MPEDDLMLVFDLGGVLIDWDPRYLYQKVFQDQEMKMNFFLGEVCTPDWNGEQDRGRSIRDAVEERVERFPAYEPFIRIYYSRWEEMISGPIQGSVRLVKQLKKAGYPLAALSNWSAETFSQVSSRFEFLNWFDPLVISGEIGMIKPEPDIFHYFLGVLDRDPETCLFIDDQQANIAAAGNLGFQTLQYRSPSQLEKTLKARGILNGFL